jgi:hypothetical protein
MPNLVKFPATVTSIYRDGEMNEEKEKTREVNEVGRLAMRFVPSWARLALGFWRRWQREEGVGAFVRVYGWRIQSNRGWRTER